MHKKSFKMIWVISILILASLACSLLTNVNQFQQDVRTAATQIEGSLHKRRG